MTNRCPPPATYSSYGVASSTAYSAGSSTSRYFDRSAPGGTKSTVTPARHNARYSAKTVAWYETSTVGCAGWLSAHHDSQSKTTATEASTVDPTISAIRWYSAPTCSTSRNTFVSGPACGTIAEW